MKNYDYDELFPNRFLKSGLFKGKQHTLTIVRIVLEEMEDKKGKRNKAIVSFQETPKQLVLNKTNGECLKGMFGRDVSKWVGKRVTFYPAMVEAFGEETQAIRVRGSPDITGDMEVACNLGQKQRTMKMTRTATAAPKAAAPAAPAAPPQPPPVTASGEPPDDVQLPGQSEPDAEPAPF